MLDTSPSLSSGNSPRGNYKKKLIEVALPLQAINTASGREKSIRHGHPSTLHLWWARRPLAACRAMLFASLVDDPSSRLEEFPTIEAQNKERSRLFALMEQLVQWDNSLNENILAQARAEIRKSVGDDLPPVYDPFCGGGAIPIEAQRLGLPTIGSDLNPIAVLITKSMTEIPWRFKGQEPVHPSLRGPMSQRTWERATGLAADVDAYGQQIIEEARKRLGSYYPNARLESGRYAPVIAWIWARTVKCNNPICGAEMPLVKSFALSTRAGKEWSINPTVDGEKKAVNFEVRPGQPLRGGTVNRRGAECLVCGEPVTLAYIREEGKAKRLGAQLMAIIAEGERGRAYVAPTDEQVRTALSAQPAWAPDTDLVHNPRHMSPPLYGITKHRDLFTPRQLLVLTTFSDLIRECRDRVLVDGIAGGLSNDDVSLESGGTGAAAYADAIATYLAMLLDRLVCYNAAFCMWLPPAETISNVYVRHSMSMVWDYAEANPLSLTTGGADSALVWIRRAIEAAAPSAPATVFRRDAAEPLKQSNSVLISTDPPYYDNVPYSDLSDLFYIWLRPTIGAVYPDLFATLLVPKSRELVADATRFGDDRDAARRFFESGLQDAFRIMRDKASSAFPISVFYAFKQAEDGDADGADYSEAGRAAVGWEAMLNGLLQSGLQIDATWPVRTERPIRPRSHNANALASSVVLACRPRAADAPRCTRSDFLRELRSELPESVRKLRDASLAATDLEQAAIGPGIAIFSKYSVVLEPDDSPMTVRAALALVNEELAQILLGEIADVDSETHFALAWFDQHGYGEAKYDDVLVRAKNARLSRLVEAGVLRSGNGYVTLLPPGKVEFDRRLAMMPDWPTWAQMVHVLRALLGDEGGEDLAAEVLKDVGPDSAAHIKDIAYHCYLVCDRGRRSTEARDFNALVQAWPDLLRLASQRGGDTLL